MIFYHAVSHMLVCYWYHTIANIVLYYLCCCKIYFELDIDHNGSDYESILDMITNAWSLYHLTLYRVISSHNKLFHDEYLGMTKL